MIEVRIPKEIRDFKEKLFFGLTLRQSICTVIALAICVPLYFWGQGRMSEDTLNWLILFVSLPLLLLGFVRYNNLTAEQLFVAWLKMQINPQKRLYKQESIYDQIRKDVINEEKKHSKLPISKGERRGKVKNGKNTQSKKGKEQSSQDSTANNSL